MKLYSNLTNAHKEREKVRALKINIKGNQFPDEILSFPNLEELYLEGSCRNFPDKAPEWARLKVLSIKWPNFNGEISSIFKLKHLELLKIIQTPLSSLQLPLGHALSPISSLTIKDCGLKTLPEEISILTHLNEMNLSGNALSSLPHAFINLKKLKRLNLDHNEFKIFPDLIKNMPHLAHISMDHNSFSEEEKARIQREFHITAN